MTFESNLLQSETMKRFLPVATASLLCCSSLQAAQTESYDYFNSQRLTIRNGVQAVLSCNGLFTSNRSIQQVFAQELAYLPNPVGTAEGGHYTVNADRKAVTVGGAEDGAPISAIFREGIGCVVLEPGQNLEELESLPTLSMRPLAGDPATIPWPNGDLVETSYTPEGVNLERLQEASDWAFNRATPEQDTLSLIVLHRGHIIHERYAPGISTGTRTRTWSTAKSIAATLIGILVDEGKMQLDAPLAIEWLPELDSEDADPRRAITLRQVLNMSSGLEIVDSFGMEYATGSGLAYWAGASSVNGARNRGLIREPGSFWDYENYDTLLAVLAMKQVLGDQQRYLEFPRRALFDRIGMRNTLASTDRFGDFIFSSQVYTNARDLARFGLLYQQNGLWNGERIISEEWIRFVRTPAPSTAGIGNFYGGQWWLVPDDRDDVPTDAYATSGNRGQYVIVVPSHEVVIVRRGLDYGKQGFNRWDLTREVLKAFDNRPIEPLQDGM
jgi:CubicO group peptidase (beta-lactamase class C family)